MDVFLLHNTETGWQGSVTEKIYRDRIGKEGYEDPREVGAREAEKPSPPAAAWEIKSKSPGWYEVVKGGETATEKSLRKEAAEKLRDELNAEQG